MDSNTIKQLDNYEQKYNELILMTQMDKMKQIDQLTHLELKQQETHKVQTNNHQAQLEHHKEQIDQFKAQEIHHKQQVVAHQSQQHHDKTQYTLLFNQHNELKKNYDDQLLHNDKFHDQHKSYQHSINELHGQIKIKCSLIASLEKQILELQGVVNLSLNQADTYNRQIKYVELIKAEEGNTIKKISNDQIKQLKEYHSKHVLDIEDQARQYNEQYHTNVDELNKDIEQKNITIVQLQKDIQQYQVIFDDKEDQIKSLNLQNDQQNQVLQQLRLDVQNGMNQIKQNDKLQVQIKDQRRQIFMSAQATKQLKLDILTLRKSLNDKQKENGLFDEQSQSAKLLLHSREDHILRLRHRLKLIENEYTKIKEKNVSIRGGSVQEQIQFYPLRDIPLKQIGYKNKDSQMIRIKKRSISQHQANQEYSQRNSIHPEDHSQYLGTNETSKIAQTEPNTSGIIS